jgi:alkanesulfonate monooxygenase SsuD/methylene tetrahydromethanopterin reductase-like flavin-dependent oxidoreductase (luciferase family)
LAGLSVARDNPSLNLNRAKQVEKGAAWVGTPETIAKQIRDYQQMVGGFEIASMQVNFSTIPPQGRRAFHAFIRPKGHSVST